MRSLTARVLLVSTIWISIALFIIAILISTLYRQGAENGFRHLLRAQLFNIISAVSVSEGGELIGTPQLSDMRYSQPNSGWYWFVDRVEAKKKVRRLASSSIIDNDLPVREIKKAPFNEQSERFYLVEDDFEKRIFVAESEVVLDGLGRVARFRVTGDWAVVEREISSFSRVLYSYFFLFGIGSLIVNAFAILFGLRPLDEVRRALEDIRSGKQEELRGEFPKEIHPLTNEINALISNNKRIVERARVQVGNLAHALKTPIAVLLNESSNMNEQQGELVKNEARSMQQQVQSYLARAQIAAQKNNVLTRVDPSPVMERLLRVMHKLNSQLNFNLKNNISGVLLAVEQQDLEEIVGNLLENAAKFASNNVYISFDKATNNLVSETAEKREALITVEDDGCGLTLDEMVEAVQRGKRLDETKPGTGLGLSIVKSIAEEYNGELKLSKSNYGGLKVCVLLPIVVDS